MTEYLQTPQGRRLACLVQPGKGPGVVFVHGYNSDMRGTKAEALADWAAGQGRAFMRLDLSGHGESGGDIAAFGPTDWREDLTAALEARCAGPQVLVGSSLGGWLALALARSRPDLVAGVVTLAAAPDFTARLAAGFAPADHAALAAQGHVTRPSDYGPDYRFGARLFQQGASEAVLAAPCRIRAPLRMIHGTADRDVPQSDALALLAHVEAPDLRLTLLRGADHRLSDPASLALMVQSVAELS